MMEIKNILNNFSKTYLVKIKVRLWVDYNQILFKMPLKIVV